MQFRIMNKIKLFASDEMYFEKCENLADKTEFDFIRNFVFPDNGEVYLLMNENGLSLTDGNLVLTGNFESILPRLRINNLNSELVVKASKIKNKDNVTVIDATAGLGEDSFLLAGAGFDVTMIEYNPVIAVLLEDALLRAGENEKTKEISGRIKFIYGDSIELMNSGNITADVVLLDPMFPKRQKSGLIKKKFQLLQKLESPCSDETGLFDAAVKAAVDKIVVKRPAKAENLAKKRPSYYYNGKSIRYDVYIKGDVKKVRNA